MCNNDIAEYEKHISDNAKRAGAISIVCSSTDKLGQDKILLNIWYISLFQPTTFYLNDIVHNDIQKSLR